MCDAESMLFIDNNKAKVGKLNLLLNKRVRTNHNVRGTAANVLQNIFTQFFLLSADEKTNMYRQIP